MPPDYWLCLFTRNGEKTLPSTLSSINVQVLKPKFVIAIDDGSTDRTNYLLKNGFSSENNVQIICTESKTTNIRRAPYLLNKALARAWCQKGLPQYMMISGDDCSYPENYAKEALECMEKDKAVIASGTWIYDSTPTGSGRFVSMDFMRELGGYYPTFYGWESWLLNQADRMGKKKSVYLDLRYAHQRTYRASRIFSWGESMFTFGYPSYYVAFRVLSNLLMPPKQRQLSVSCLVSMLAGYLSARLRKIDRIPDRGFTNYIYYISTRTIFSFVQLPVHRFKKWLA